MERNFILTQNEIDEALEELTNVFDRSLLLRGLISLYVAEETEYTFQISFEQLVQAVDGLTCDFCERLKGIKRILDKAEILPSDKAKEGATNVIE